MKFFCLLKVLVKKKKTPPSWMQLVIVKCFQFLPQTPKQSMNA